MHTVFFVFHLLCDELLTKISNGYPENRDFSPYPGLAFISLARFFPLTPASAVFLLFNHSQSTPGSSDGGRL